MSSDRHSVAPVGVALLALAVVGSVGLALGVGPKLLEAFPDVGLTDDERQARVDAARERERRYLADFVAGGEDPRALPRIYIETFAAAPSTLDEVVREASLIVRGTVVATTFTISDEGLSRATSRVSVRDVVDGEPLAEIVVEQRGGPVPQEDGGALAALESDPIVLPGDEVILLLRAGEGGAFHTVHGGIYLVESGLIRVIETPEVFALSRSVDGMSEVAFVDAIEAALVRR